MGWHQGKYYPINQFKYIGNGNPIYRSGWEKSYFLELDQNPNVIRWAAEYVKLPYVYNLDNRKHNYYVDLYFEKRSQDRIYKVLVEIKPFKELFPPEIPKKKTYKSMKGYNFRMASYHKNQSKWKFAQSFAINNSMEFYILTERGIYSFVNNMLVKISDKTYF